MSFMNQPPLNLSPPVALGYVRVSTDQQDLSVDAQTVAVKRAAEYQDLGPVEIFAESDTSGSLPFHERDQGSRLLERVRALNGAPCTIIVPKVDRLGRDSVDVNQNVRLLDSMGARVVFLDINVDTRTPMGRAFMQIAAVFAELELARIRERIQTALDHKQSKGELCGTVSYGFNAVETGEVTAKGTKIKRLVDNPEEQKWILWMDQQRSFGTGYHTIAKKLNELGVPTKRKGQMMNLLSGGVDKGHVAAKFTSGQWQAGNVKKVLTNKTTVAWLQNREQPLQKAA